MFFINFYRWGNNNVIKKFNFLLKISLLIHFLLWLISKNHQRLYLQFLLLRYLDTDFPLTP